MRHRPLWAAAYSPARSGTRSFAVSDPEGYSGTPLAKKLGLKDGHVAGFAGLPETLSWLADERDFAVLDRDPVEGGAEGLKDVQVLGTVLAGVATS